MLRTSKFIHQQNIRLTPMNLSQTVYINNIIILPTNSAKYRGLYFNNELNFDTHINLIRQTTTAQLFNLRRLLPYMNTTTTTLLTHSLIMSRLQ